MPQEGEGAQPPLHIAADTDGCLLVVSSLSRPCTSAGPGSSTFLLPAPPYHLGDLPEIPDRDPAQAVRSAGLSASATQVSGREDFRWMMRWRQLVLAFEGRCDVWEARIGVVQDQRGHEQSHARCALVTASNSRTGTKSA
jgi:hypothetical protein